MSAISIGIDIGYGYTKVFTIKNGEPVRVLFPTIATGYVPRAIFNSEPIVTVHVNDKAYTVGSDASQYVSGNFTVSDDFVGSNEYFALLGYALQKTGVWAQSLVLGLPPALYNEAKAQELIQKLYRIQLSDAKKRTIVVPGTIKYIPQGAGVYFSHIGNNAGSKNKNVAVIDIGYYTLDFVFFSEGKFLDGSAKSYPIGVKKLYDEVLKLFSRTYGSFIGGDETVEKLIKHGRFHHFGQEYVLDVSHLVNEFYIEQIQRAIKNYSNALKETKKIVDEVIIGGGGVSFVNNIGGAVVVENPQYANAQGYYLYGEYISRK